MGGIDPAVVVQLLSHVQLFDPMHCSMPGSSVPHYLPFSQFHVHWVVMLSNHLFLCHSLLLLPSIFPSIRIFSNESSLHIRWPKYWSFSFSITPSNEYSGLISYISLCKWHNTTKSASLQLLTKKQNSGLTGLSWHAIGKIHRCWNCEWLKGKFICKNVKLTLRNCFKINF